MGYIPLVCPQCGAKIDLDDSREFGFCSYCGTKIIRDKVVVEHRGSVGVDHSDEITNLLRRANESLSMGDAERAENYYNRVLDMDYDNEIARKKLDNIYKTVIKEPNLSISVISGKMYNKNARVSVSIDGVERGVIANGTSDSFLLSAGSHKVRLKLVGVPLYKMEFVVDIADRFSKFSYLATCKFGNTIEIS